MIAVPDGAIPDGAIPEGAPPMTRSANETMREVTERMLLSALRAEDAADAAEIARERAQFLADLGLHLGASLDQELTYTAISELGLPGLDAWCVVDVVEVDGGIRRIAVLHPEDAEAEAARALARQWPPSADDRIGVPVMNQDLAPVVVAVSPDTVLASLAPDENTQDLLWSLGTGPVLVVPIKAHDVLLGAITFVRSRSPSGYTAEDVRFGEALAARCAQALESARLYTAARAAWAAADAARAEGEAARHQAESANATKAQFLGTMSHELRTPLNAIGGYAQLIEMGLRGPVTDEQKLDLASIQRSKVHLLGLVDSVLNYAQIEAGRVQYVTADINVIEVVSGVHALVAPQMNAKGLAYRFEKCAHGLTARAEASKVTQIVLNLLGNATKFTPYGGHIIVTCGESAALGERRMVEVRVTDTGLGIAPDKIEAVFDPFVQIDRRLTSSDIGVGLGLAISRELARGMGGDLTAESAPNEGSTFTLTLPAA